MTTPIYDQLDAEQFIFQKTGESVENVREFLLKHFRFQELCSISEPEEDPGAEMELHSELITSGFNDPNDALAYIERTTNLSRTTIARMYAEEVGYMASIGVIDAEAYPYFLEWAKTIEDD